MLFYRLLPKKSKQTFMMLNENVRIVIISEKIGYVWFVKGTGLKQSFWSHLFTSMYVVSIFFYYFRVFCSRYVQEHMLFHSIESQHLVTLSFSDISVWCYACEDYVSIYHFLYNHKKIRKDLEIKLIYFFIGRSWMSVRNEKCVTSK